MLGNEGTTVELYWFGIFMMVCGILASAFVIQTFFPMGQDNKRHYVNSDYFKKHPIEKQKTD